MDIELSTVLKWGVTILVTGFIAQFGKMLAKYIVEKIKSRKSGDSTGGNGPDRVIEPGNDIDESRMIQPQKINKETLKAQKKKLKADRKLKKKEEG